jgi:phosphate transport system permease protein
MAATAVMGARPRPKGDPVSTWRWSQRLAFALAWACGILVCLIAAAIVGYMGFRGVQYLRPSLIAQRPTPGLAQGDVGGILDPLIGTVLLTIIGIAIAVPLGVISATWCVEYGRPAPLARAVESGIEIVAGTPDIVLAIFGLAVFQLHILAPLSFTASVPRRRSHHVAHRAAARVRRHAGGADGGADTPA